MTSRVRIRSSRANGALSRGPKTPAGKLRAAGNSCKHGFYSTRAVLKTESQDEFNALLDRFTAGLQPRNDAESKAVRQIVIAAWCLRRVMNTERRLLDEALAAVPPNPEDPDSATAQAWVLAAQKPVFKQLSRLESRFSRQYGKACENLRAARKLTLSENRHPNPLNEIFIPIPTQSLSATCSDRPILENRHPAEQTAPKTAPFAPENPPETAVDRFSAPTCPTKRPTPTLAVSCQNKRRPVTQANTSSPNY